MKAETKRLHRNSIDDFTKTKISNGLNNIYETTKQKIDYCIFCMGKLIELHSFMKITLK